MNENKIVKAETASPALSKGQKFQVELMAELDKSMSVMGVDFTDYGKKCVINAIGSLILYCQNNEIELGSINPILLKTQLQNVGLTELNCAGLPSEAYFDLRKSWMKVVDKDTGEEKSKLVYNIAIKPQGAGNEKLVRKYGVGIKQETGLHQAILVHEGDEFELPQFNGIETTPFIYKPKYENMNNKVILVCYPVVKVDGSVEYLIASREGIKPNIIAQIRQNALYKFKTETTGANGRKYEKTDVDARDRFYAQLDKEAETLKVDELLTKYADYVNPTYTSGGSKEAMILRKMKNNALKSYPKEYDNSFIKSAVEDMFEEHDESVLEKPKAVREVDVVEKVEKELDTAPVEDAPKDFEVYTEEKVDVKSTPKEEKVEPSIIDLPEEDRPF